MSKIQQIKAALIWRPEIVGLEVIEPQTQLERNLAQAEWDKVTRGQVEAMDSVLDYAFAHTRELLISSAHVLTDEVQA